MIEHVKLSPEQLLARWGAFKRANFQPWLYGWSGSPELNRDRTALRRAGGGRTSASTTEACSVSVAKTKQTEVRRLRRPRSSAAQVMQGRSPLRRDIALELEIHVGPRNSRITGDLDIFVTGVCDGLMAADPRAVRTEIWGADAGGPICLSIAIVIEDDCEFMAITARKVVGDTVAPWYLVRLAGD